MKKKISEIIIRLIGDDGNLTHRLVNILALLGSLAFFVSGTVTLVEGQGMAAVLILYSCAAVLLLTYFLAAITKRYEDCAFFILMLLAIAIFPYTYFVSGGLDSGMIAWLVLGTVTAAFVLDGWRLIISLVLGIGADLFCFLYSYMHPEAVTGVLDRHGRYFDTVFSYLCVVFCLLLFLEIHKMLFRKEHDKNVKQQEELEAALSTQNRFLANISHEIRTPINTIIGLNEMTLRERTLTDDLVENSVNIQKASKNLLAIINDILDLSRMESGHMEIIPTRYETQTLLSDLVNTNWQRAKEKDLDFRVNIDENIPAVLLGDDVRVKQIINNLLTNAVKYTRKGSVTLSAGGRPDGRGNFVLKISVEDTGIGIRKDDLGKLFDSFSRVDEKENKGIEGTGLGLPIVSQLVGLMKGEVNVDSVYGKGSVFTVSIPQGIISESKIGHVDLHTASGMADRPNYRQVFEAPEARVMVVDDNDMNLLVAGKLLRSTKVKLDLVASGAEALKLTAKNSYDVILMDHVMPGMDGVETLHRIREQADGYNRKTPVIVMTANAMSGAYEQYSHLGFSDYIAKPVNSALLEATLLHYIPERLIEYSMLSETESEESGQIKMITTAKKQKVCITADAVCDLDVETLGRLGVPVINYYVETGDGRFEDGAEIFQDNLTAYLENSPHKQVVSAPPSVEEYEEFFSDVLARAEHVIHITSSAKVSKGYEQATAAATSFSSVTVVDSYQLSSGMGLVVMKAARLAMDGADPEAVIKGTLGMRDKVETSFIVDNLEYLYRNGRVSKAVYLLMKNSNIHPVIALMHGRMTVAGMFLGDLDKCYAKYVKSLFARHRDVDHSAVFVTHVGLSAKERYKIKETMARYVEFENIYEVHASGAISSNSGPGSVGVLFIKK